MTSFDIEEMQRVIARIRRKTEVMKMDQKSRNSVRQHDSNEILSLLDILERKLGGK